MDISAFRMSGQFYKQYKVRLGHGRSGIPFDTFSHRTNCPHVSLRFSIPKFGGKVDKFERFFIPIESEAFADLAQEMMGADPQEAIRAFAKAMQEVQIPRPRDREIERLYPK